MTHASESKSSLPEQGILVKPEDVIEKLRDLNIKHQVYSHDPVFTVEDGLYLHDLIPGGHCKNLFLKDKKNQRWLVSAIESTKIDLKKLPKLINSARLSFGSPDRLWESLRVKPGSVTPFALLNDTTCHIRVILDKALFDFEVINFHPLINNQSVTLAPNDLITYIKSCGHEPEVVDFNHLSD